jgi:hypothetical protein
MASIPVATLYGMAPPAQEQAHRGLTQLQHRFERQAAAAAAKATSGQAHTQALRGLLNVAESGSAELSALLQARRQEHEQAARRRTPVPDTRTTRTRLFTGSIGATLAPPYNWSWTWEAGNGGPAANTASADSDNGTWSVSDWTSFSDSSNASARAAVGVFFRPPTENGILQVWSGPALNYDWGDWCVLDGAGSDGWLGLYIGEYAVEGGGFVSAPVDQQISLWSDNSWWAGVGEQEGSSSGYPLFAELEVDNDHFYEIWVWGGTDVYAAGWGNPFWGSGAGGDLSATVPSITWELY